MTGTPQGRFPARPMAQERARWEHAHVDGPTWQETLTAWATLGAVVVALGLGLTGFVLAERDRREHRKKDAEWRQREDARQANCVSAWQEHHPSRSTSAAVEVVAVAHNGSDEPVWDVTVRVEHIAEFGGGEVPDRWATVSVPIGMIPPRERVVRDLRRTPPDSYSPAPLEMTFRDNAGAWWRRNEHGVLGELAGPPTFED